MADINLTAAEVAQLILSIGNAAALSTKDKTSLVAAINETLATAEAGGSPKAEKVSYSGNIDGTTVANVKAALDKLSARQGVLTVNATYTNTSGAVSADCTYEQISAAVAQKKSVICIVTATLGGKVVIPLSTLSDNAAYFRAPEADGNAMGIRTLALGKNTGTWTMDVDLDKALCFTDEVAFPTVKGETLDLTGLAFWPRDPEVGELVVGANGYTGEVTALAADGDPIITATGERIFTFAASDITYSGTIDGTAVQDVDAALDALAAREAVLIVNAQQSISNTITADKTYAEISAAGEGGKEVICVLTVAQIGSKAIFRLDHLGSKATFRQTYVSGNQTQTITLNVNSSDVWTMETEKETPAGIGAVPKSRTVNGKALLEDITIASQDIGYSGSVGDAGSSPNTVSNVAEALVALTVGEPLNVTANFVDSGAASVAEWAVAGSGDYYNIGEGYYIIATTDTRYYVRVLGVTAMTQRVVQIWKYGRDYIDPTIEIWRCTAPGATPEMLLRYEADRGDLTIPNQRWDWQVPDYRSAEKGQVLVASGSDAKPGWGNLPMATASAAGGVKADAKTENDTVPVRIDADGKLWVKVPDAPLIVTVTNVENNTGTVDYSSSEILAAVSAGREVYLRGSINGLTLVFAFGGTFQGQLFFYNIFTVGLANGAMLAMVEGNQVHVNNAGFATSDDLDVFENTIEPQLLPEVTAADNGKFARVVNGRWVAQALTNVSEVGA